MKRCSACGISKVVTAFTKQKQRSGNYTLMFECKECAVVRQIKRYQNQTIEQKRAKKSKFLMRAYGITIEDYDVLFAQQNGKCASCDCLQTDLKKALVVDHCHTTKKVRGLLCSGCNLAIGNLKENVDCMHSLAGYMTAFA